MISSFVITAALVSRTVVPVTTGPNRLNPDVALLAGASPLRYSVTRDRHERRFALQGGLDDLRLRDASGAEVQYLLIGPAARVAAWRTGSILPIPSSKVSSGFEADLGAMTTVDRISIDGIATPFLKRLRLDGSGDRAHWTTLDAEATMFDLPEQQLRNVEVRFAPGEYRYLRVTWDDRNSARVRYVGNVAARIYDDEAPPPSVSIAVPFRRKTSELGKSRYRIALPGPHLPVAAIELQIANANVFRDASVSEPRLDGATLAPVDLGAAKLRRAERDGVVAEDMSVPISIPQGADLDLLVDDGNSGPLAISAVVARLAPLPWIYFESRDRAPLEATYGDASLSAPRYDLEASRRSIEKSHPVIARWSPATIKRAISVTASLPLDGASIDRKPFRYSRMVGLLSRGLTSLVLDADVLSHSTSLNDIRLVDNRGRQVPYLLEKRDAPLAITLTVPRRTAGQGTSSLYRFALPYDRLPPGTRIVITTGSRVFDRNVTLERPADESHGRDAEIIESAQWRSADSDSPAPALTFTAPLTGKSVELRVDEGDNAPLPIASVQLLLPSYALRFVSSGTPLTLLYGDPSASAPRYDLALLAPQLLSESAREVTLPPAIVTPSGEVAQRERTIFWAVIIGAAIVLLITLGRLLTDGLSEAGA